jgi:hypothetical protein
MTQTDEWKLEFAHEPFLESAEYKALFAVGGVSDVLAAITNNVKAKLDTAETLADKGWLFDAGVASLLGFIQAGWTGPNLSFTTSRLIASDNDIDVIITYIRKSKYQTNA